MNKAFFRYNSTLFFFCGFYMFFHHIYLFNFCSIIWSINFNYFAFFFFVFICYMWASQGS